MKFVLTSRAIYTLLTASLFINFSHVLPKSYLLLNKTCVGYLSLC